ncbi:MAG: 50S ribosomal protein L6 [Candidatus Omnitrophica bacterium]|nr:50S ribosomal protein L6 [Candidatus Omnitrophota bacterium]
MSRIGKKPIKIPEKVKVAVASSTVTVEGPKGSLKLNLHPNLKVTVKDGQVIVENPGSERQQKALFGLTRSMIYNNVLGVTQGYTKELDIEGVGFRANLKGKTLELALGFTHPVLVEIPAGIEIKVEKQTHLTISGIDKHLVGQMAASIRALYEPEPYKGKGIRYAGEHVRRKQGKKVA